jgi:NADH:ubiquinone reductase (H+-translocating)
MQQKDFTMVNPNSTVKMHEKPHVVIVGGGFGGLEVAKKLRRANVQITLIDRRNFHLFQPLLYQVATGALSPANIAAPLRVILKDAPNVKVLLAEVAGFDLAARKVILRDGQVPYDTLVVAAGVRHQYFDNPHWEAFAPGLKTIEDATHIRREVLYAFEAAEREPEIASTWLNFVVVGGGPSGVEVAGALGEIARFTLRNNFRQIDPTKAKILLVEAGERILPSYPDDLATNAQSTLEKFGVTVRTNTKVIDMSADTITLKTGDHTEVLPTRTVVWAAGVIGSPLARMLAEATGAQLDRIGRITPEADLSLPGHPEVFVLGDMAHVKDREGQPLAGVAPVAQQQGRYVGKLIRARLAGSQHPADKAPFFYYDKGSMATIGRAAAVANLNLFGWRLKLSGFWGWLSWLFIHLMALVRFENRLLVLMQWAVNYFTRSRNARLITGDPEPLPERYVDVDVAKRS